MSLSALNSPPLITTAGIGLGYALPFIEDMIMKSPWSAVRVANLLSYGINVISVSRPGRMDGEGAEDGELSPRRGKTLVAPAGWAFAIWGPIFLGEAIGIASQFLLSDKNTNNAVLINLLKKTSGPFIIAQFFQTLWCAAFRPKYKDNKMFISAGMLVGTAFSLSKAHAVFTANRGLYSPLQYGIFFLPMALHFGWVSAASIVNLNGAVSLQKDAKEKVIAFVGHASVIAATVLGIVISNKRNAPVYSGVIAWALSAVADSMKKRIENSKATLDKKDKKKQSASQVGIYGASTQLFLSKSGAILNAAATSALAFMLLFSKGATFMPEL